MVSAKLNLCKSGLSAATHAYAHTWGKSSGVAGGSWIRPWWIQWRAGGQQAIVLRNFLHEKGNKRNHVAPQIPVQDPPQPRTQVVIRVISTGINIICERIP